MSLRVVKGLVNMVSKGQVILQAIEILPYQNLLILKTSITLLRCLDVSLNTKTIE